MTFSIIQKSQLEGAQRLDAGSWFRYVKPIYDKRRKLINPEKSKLVSIIDNKKYEKLKNLIEEVGKNVRNFEHIFRIKNQLKDADADDRIDDMISELRAASYLIDQGYREIEYQKKALDFKCRKGEKDFLIEVKFFRGPDFKTQDYRKEVKAYKLSPDKLIDLLKNKLKEAEKQLDRYNKHNEKMLIFVTNLLEAEMGWFGGEVMKWCENQKMEVIFITRSGDIY